MLSGQLSLSPVEDVAVHRWMVGSDNGASSRYMVSVLMGRPSAEPYSFPRDLADLGRCIRALEQMPFLIPRLSLLRKSAIIWMSIVQHWPLLSDSYRRSAQGKSTFYEISVYFECMLEFANSARGVPTSDELASALSARPENKQLKSRSKKRPFYIENSDLSMMVGESVSVGSHFLKGVQLKFSSPCSKCGCKREVFFDGPLGPTRDKEMCDPCSRGSIPPS